MQHYDLVIVGGGLVGTGLLLGLQQHIGTLRIALIDASVPRENDPRLFALSMSSWQFLKNIGLHKALQGHVTPIKSVHVSHKGRFGALRLRHQDVDLPALGYMVGAAQIESAMHQALKTFSEHKTSTITVFRPAKLTALTQDERQVSMVLTTQTGDETITADYVIGADGTESTVRKLLQLETAINDYQQSAIVTQTSLERAHQEIAYERFVAQGAIAMLPLQDNKVATIWSGQHELLQKLYQLSDEEFLTELQKAFGFRLGNFVSVAKRFMFPLKYVSSTKMQVNRVLLLGNALHTVHPIAAQGFNLALYEIAMLIEVLHDHHNQLSTKVMTALTKALTSQQKISLRVTNRITQLFFHDSLLTKLFLPFGLFAFDKITPLKTRFLQHMLGRRTAPPRLLLNAEGPFEGQGENIKENVRE